MRDPGPGTADDRTRRARCRDPRGAQSPIEPEPEVTCLGHPGAVRAAPTLRRAGALSGRPETRQRRTSGAALFDKHCQTCHQHQGRGHKVGPDLSGIAGRAPEALLVDILDPNREVPPDYLTLIVATRRGQLLSGLLAEESATTLKLRHADAVEETLLRSEIEDIRSTAQSLMPEGLEQNLSLQDVADLIAFLRQGDRAPRSLIKKSALD